MNINSYKRNLIKRLFFFSLIIFTYPTLNAQNLDFKATLKYLETSQIDSVHIDSIYQRFEFDKLESGDSLALILEILTKHSTKVNYKKGLADSYFWTSWNLSKQGNYVKSLEFIYKGLSLYDALQDSTGMADSYYIVAELLYEDDFLQARDAAEKYLTISKSLKDTIRIVDALLTKSTVVSGDMEGIDMGYKILTEAVKLLNEKNKSFINKTGPKIQTINSLRLLEYTTYNALGYHNRLRKKYDEAIRYYEIAIKFEKEIENFSNYRYNSYVTSNIGLAYAGKSMLGKAVEYGKKAYQMALKQGSYGNIVHASDFYHKALQETGNYKKAYEVLNTNISFKDSLRMDEVRNDNMKKQLQFEHEKELIQLEEEQKRKDLIAEKESERQRLLLIWIISGLVVTIVFVIIVYNKLRLIKSQNVIIEGQRERMEKELVLAHDIQMNMIPRDFPVFVDKPEFDLYGKIIPAREVGGDFYDFYMLDDTTLFICIGDVSGKGAGAALFMALAKSVTKAKTVENPSPAFILTELNNELSQNNDSFMFVTMFASTINISTGLLTYTNAGHNPTLIKKQDGTIELLKKVHGPVIAAMEGISYQEDEVKLEKDDLVILYTDGVTEAMSIENQLYSDRKFQELIEGLKVPSPKHLTNIVVEDVLKHTGEAEQFDDITMLTLQYKV
jgi:serine phosphatase RsbU (regulator of sigma subunit)